MTGQLSLLSEPPASDYGFSPCRSYRYVLDRPIGRASDVPPDITFVCLNPSTATPETDDHTTKKLMGFTTRWGGRTYTLVNMFALRSTDPNGLLRSDDPVGPDNNDWIASEARRARLVVLAWGAFGSGPLGRMVIDRAYRVLGVLKNRELYCIGTTKEGWPRHPLYLSYDCKPSRWSAP